MKNRLTMKSSVWLSRSLILVVLILVSILKSVKCQDEGNFVGGDVCIPSLLNYTEPKLEYRVGVLAIRGQDAAYAEFNKTFSDYLTSTAGKRFSPAITFKLIPLNFIALFDDVEKATQTSGADGVDFIYVNPSAFSCIESEYAANTLVSQISRRVVGGQEYHLTKFGGVIFARKDNANVNTIADIKDKTVACASISGLGSGQMQFRLLQASGLSYIQDPKQIVFTSNQGKVVNGVLQGNFDVGFVRTDQIERTKDADGNLVDKSLLKIINGHYELLDGEPFPFESSTILYPEWNVGSLTHVPNNVAIEVQNAMLNLAKYADIGASLQQCYTASNCTADETSTPDACKTTCYSSVPQDLLTAACDVTPELAELALVAKQNGKYSGWRSTLSYMELRNMQEETNFIRKDEDSGINACIRSKRIVDAVICPPGHFRRQEDEVLNGCANVGLDCGDFQCLCKPCVEAFDVDVRPVEELNQVDGFTGACPKFAICGTVEQSKNITFQAVDNKGRTDPGIRVRVLEGASEEELDVVKERVSNFTYEFTFDARRSQTGIVIFEVYADGTQIPESPFRLEVTERQCAEETGDPLREVDDLGNCVCSATSVEFLSNCVANAILIPSIVVPACLLLFLVVYLYVERKRKQADSVWAVNPEELMFDYPPAILGRGTFGLVLLAEYRGTQVAVKRVIPPKVKSKKPNGHESDASWRNSLLGEGDMADEYETPEQRTDEDNGAFEFEFIENDLNKMEEFDAMESGVLSHGNKDDNYHHSSNKSVAGDSHISTHTKKTMGTQGRRASIGSSAKQEEANRRNSFFDFNHLKDGNNLAGSHSNFGKRNSDGDLGGDKFDGRESGGMNKLLAKLQQEKQSAAAVVPKTSRRHSIGGMGFGGFHMPDLGSASKQPTRGGSKRVRRGSDASVNSAAFEEIVDGIVAEKELEPAPSQAPPKENEEQSSLAVTGNAMARRHSTGGGVPFPFPGLKSGSGPGIQQQKDMQCGSDLQGAPKNEYPPLEPANGVASNHTPGQTTTGRRGSGARRSSESSWSIDSADFKKLMDLEANEATDSKNSRGHTSGKHSGLYQSSGSLKTSSDEKKKKWSMMKTMKYKLLGTGDDYSKLKADFIIEMRHLSKLRHPCITTVMGAVISSRSEPMLVMEYMDHGSLYDLLHNESMIVDGELVLPILRDIAQGVRFLHAAAPQVIHGDLKAQNGKFFRLLLACGLWGAFPNLQISSACRLKVPCQSRGFRSFSEKARWCHWNSTLDGPRTSSWRVRKHCYVRCLLIRYHLV